MKKNFILMFFGFFFAQTVSAQMSLDDAAKKALENCGDTSEIGERGRARQVFSVSAWTGGCLEGKRDGRGSLNYRYEDAISNYVVTNHQEGQFVKGQRFGLWCLDRQQSFLRGRPISSSRNYDSCTVFYGTGRLSGNGPFRKLADGRWQLIYQGMPAAPPTFVAAGALEAESSRVLAAAAAGNFDGKSGLAMQSQILLDLVRGSKILSAPSPSRISLAEKRVALVLSSQMIAEMERFNRERHALISATSGLTGESAAMRDKFISASNPDRLMTNLLKVVRRYAREALPYDDSLSGLRKAGFDYALIVDWKYTTRLDLLGKYDSFPLGTEQDAIMGKVSALVGESLSGFLVNPQLEAVRIYPSPENKGPRKGQANGDSAYLEALQRYFDHAWGTSQAYADGTTVYHLQLALRYQNEQ